MNETAESSKYDEEMIRPIDPMMMIVLQTLSDGDKKLIITKNKRADVDDAWMEYEYIKAAAEKLLYAGYMPVMQKVEDGQMEEVLVETGLIGDGSLVEVKEGISEGDKNRRVGR